MLVKQGKGAMGAKHKAMMASAAVKRLRNRRWLMIWIIQGVQNEIFQFQMAVTLKHCISEVCSAPKMSKPECSSEVVFYDLANTFWHSPRARDAQLLKFEKVNFVFGHLVWTDSRSVKGNSYFLYWL